MNVEHFQNYTSLDYIRCLGKFRRSYATDVSDKVEVSFPLDITLNTNSDYAKVKAHEMIDNLNVFLNWTQAQAPLFAQLVQAP